MPHQNLEIDGKSLPSVTEILSIIDKPYLRYWYGKVGLAAATKISQEAANKGSENHAVVETAWKTPQPNSVLTFLSSQGITVVDMEQQVLSEKHKYHGCFDILGSFAGNCSIKCKVSCKRHVRYAVVDLKFSPNFDEMHKYQTAAYALAIEEMSGLSVSWGYVVYIDKDSMLVYDKVKKYEKGKSILFPHPEPFLLPKYKNGFVLLRKTYKEIKGE